MTARTRRRSTGPGASRSRTNGSAHSSSLIGSSRLRPPIAMQVSPLTAPTPPSTAGRQGRRAHHGRKPSQDAADRDPPDTGAGLGLPRASIPTGVAGMPLQTHWPVAAVHAMTGPKRQ
jgi:hypothetical protein